MALLWPMTTPGRPEKLKPETSNGHVLPTLLQCSPTCVQIPGMVAPRCGSLASSGLPVVVWSPETTQEFDPTPSPWPSSSGSPLATFCTESSDLSRSWVSMLRRTSVLTGAVVHLPSLPIEPADMIGWFRSYGYCG